MKPGISWATSFGSLLGAPWRIPGAGTMLVRADCYEENELRCATQATTLIDNVETDSTHLAEA
jgi:hypothetical protein